MEMTAPTNNEWLT